MRSKRRKSKEFTNDVMVKINGNVKKSGQINIGASKLKKPLQGNFSSSTLDILKKLKQKKNAAPILNQDIKIDEFTEDETSKSSESVTPTPKFSAKTQELLNEIELESKLSDKSKAFRGISGTSNNGLTMIEKHQDLLSVTRKLVMPAQFRALIQMSKYIDTALNFLKNRRMNTGASISSQNQNATHTGQTFISFNAVKDSVAMTQGKTLSLK